MTKKPHIFKVGGGWICTSGEVWQSAWTPQKAYKRWKIAIKDRIKEQPK